jgi:hypothetical protein
MAQPLREPQDETRSYTERIRELIEQDRVGGARKLLAEALERGAQEKDLALLQRILGPAKFLRVGGERDIDRTPDFQWLKDHGDMYRGQWVALFGGELLAHGENLKDLLAELEKHPLGRRALLQRLY